VSSKKYIIVIQGATASGKTGLAIDMAETFNAEIISADSRQLYKEMSIGVARPSDQELARVVHHFIASHSIKDEMTAAKFSEEARSLLKNYFLTKDILVLVGGSGMYIDAILNGFDNLPSDKDVKTKILYAYEKKGISFLKEEAERLDANALEGVDLNNPRRLMRIIEILTITGLPLKQLKTGDLNTLNIPFFRFCIEWDRQDLYQRINSRVDKMIDNGLELEAMALGDYKNLTALKTVGYQEWYETTSARQDTKLISDKIKQHSRNYAKRQLTWLSKYKDLIRLNPYSNFDLKRQVLNGLHNYGMIIEN